MKIIYWVFTVFLLCVLPTIAKNTSKNFDLLVQERGKVVTFFAKQPIKIAFATPLKQVSDYWRRSIDSFKGRMNEIGLKYKISEFSTKIAEARKLRESIGLALKTKPDYLILTLNNKGDEAIISRLLVQKKVKIILQNITRINKNWEDTQPLIYIGFSHKLGARKLAQKYREVFRKKKNVKYAMLYYTVGSQVSKYRGDYFNSIIRRKTNFRLVSEFYTSGDRAKSRRATLKIINKHPDVDFIYACSTDIAFGVLDALKERGLKKKIVVNGWGGGTSELKSILKKDLDFTVMRMNDDNGVAMAEAIRLDLLAKKIPQVYSGKMVIVGQETSLLKISSLQKEAFRYSGK